MGECWQWMMLTSGNPSLMCFQMSGSVCIYREHVFLSSLIRVALFDLWCGISFSLASLLYLSCGFSCAYLDDGGGAAVVVVGCLAFGFVFSFSVFCCLRTGIGGRSVSTAEFWIRSIHWLTSSVIPHPPAWPGKIIILAVTIPHTDYKKSSRANIFCTKQVESRSLNKNIPGRFYNCALVRRQKIGAHISYMLFFHLLNIMLLEKMVNNYCPYKIIIHTR